MHVSNFVLEVAYGYRKKTSAEKLYHINRVIFNNLTFYFRIKILSW